MKDTLPQIRAVVLLGKRRHMPSSTWRLRVEENILAESLDLVEPYTDKFFLYALGVLLGYAVSALLHHAALPVFTPLPFMLLGGVLCCIFGYVLDITVVKALRRRRLHEIIGSSQKRR